MPPPHGTADPPPLLAHAQGRTGVRLLIALGLAAMLTAAAVQGALRSGRFDPLPGPQQAAWMARGAAWAEILQSGGLVAVVKDYAADPPRALYPVAAATGGFTLFGFHDWAPHAAGFALALALLLAADRATRGAPAGPRIAALVFAATVPFVGLAAGEPHAAVASGLCTATGTLLVLARSFSHAGPLRQLGAGALFAAAFLCDASAGTLAASMLTASLVLAAGTDLLIGGVRRGDTARSWAFCLFGAAVLSLPHALALANAGGMFEALRPVPAEPWTDLDGTRVRVRWYLNGPSGTLMLGPHLYLLVLPLGAAASMYVHRWRRDELVRTGALATALGLTYLVPLLSPTRSLLAGAPFQILLMLLSLVALGRLLTVARGRPAVWASAFAVSLAVGGLVLWSPSAVEMRTPQSVASRAAAETTYRAVREHAGLGSDRILVVGEDPALADVLRYWSIRDRAGLSFAAIRAADPPALDAALDGADFLIASAAGDAADRAPAALRTTLSRRRDFEPVQTASDAAGEPLSLFRTIGPFAGFDAVSGLRGPEGPHPQWGMPSVRWGEGPQTVLRVRAEEAGTLRLFALCRVFRYNQAVTVLVDGRPVGEFPLEGGDWRTVAVRVPVEPGEHTVELIYAAWDDEEGQPPNAVLFRTLRTLIER